VHNFSDHQKEIYTIKWSPTGRGLHSSTFQLKVSAFFGIGGVFRGYVRGVYEVPRGVRGCVRVINGSS